MNFILEFMLVLPILIVVNSVPIGSSCTSTSQCVSGAFCSHSLCRRASCQIHGECSKDELCFYGKADGEFRDACFPLKDQKFQNFVWCPGNGDLIKNVEGEVETCDFESPCSSNNVCNPMYGVCCSKMRTCPAPMLPVVEVLTGKPILCKLRGSPVLECPLGSHCQPETSFCCTDKDVAEKKTQTTSTPVHRKSEPKVDDLLPEEKTSKDLLELPTVGHLCEEGRGCAYGAVCQCIAQTYQQYKSEKVCRCECPKEVGYILAADGRTCKRSRRKLKEKCKWDLECLSAYSECTSGGCRCKTGFKRDGNGGCKPIAYKCVNQAEALKFDGRIIGCVMEKRNTFARYHQVHQISSFDTNSKSRGSGSEESSNSFFSSSEASQGKSSISTNSSNSSSKEYSRTSISSSDSSTQSISQEQSSKKEGQRNKRHKNKRFRTIRNNQKQCPNQYYCVALFDLPKRPNFYQGFCCPIPDPKKPQCPVGIAHKSSQPPNYGCQDCPWDHYCHLDGVATQVEVCCPKPCVSPEDVFLEGQCHPLVYYGDTCNVSEQCLSGTPPTNVNSPISKNRKLLNLVYEQKERLTPLHNFLVESIVEPANATDVLLKTVDLECRKNRCACPAGYFFKNGVCKRLQCSVGLKGEPSVDSRGDLLICRNSHDCSKGSMCEPGTKICCKGNNRCPKGFVETGQLCGRQKLHTGYSTLVQQECAKESDICIIPKHTKDKICCTEENA